MYIYIYILYIPFHIDTKPTDAFAMSFNVVEMFNKMSDF